MTTTKSYGPAPLAHYTNGNVRVSLWENGTKLRSYRGEPREEFPESIDIKVTDRCDLGCPYCHEGSARDGRHGDLGRLVEVLSPLPPGPELAIGGGDPLCHPGLEGFLREAKGRGWVCNLTVNADHFVRDRERVAAWSDEELVHAVGISLAPGARGEAQLQALNQGYWAGCRLVAHIIAGVHAPGDLGRVLQLYIFSAALILGYKDFRRGSSYLAERGGEVEARIGEWRRELFAIFRSNPYSVLAFDNLAVEQLAPQRLMTRESWDVLYTGADFQHSMYIDAVEGLLAPTSRSPAAGRTPWDAGILEFFASRKSGEADR